MIDFIKQFFQNRSLHSFIYKLLETETPIVDDSQWQMCRFRTFVFDKYLIFMYVTDDSGWRIFVQDKKTFDTVYPVTKNHQVCLMMLNKYPPPLPQGIK